MSSGHLQEFEKNYNAVNSKSGRGRFREVVVNERFLLLHRLLTGTNLVFWISGRLWEVVVYKRWSHVSGRFDCTLFILLVCFLVFVTFVFVKLDRFLLAPYNLNTV